MGVDNNCDGNIDEGATGGLTYVGNLLFTNQAQVDAFSTCYYIIDGNLTNLINLVEVTGNVLIKSTGQMNMAGLDNLTDIGGDLTIRQNNSLTTLDGLDAVVSVGGNLRVFYNRYLVDCCAVHDLLANAGVGGSTTIFRNDMGCDSESEVEVACAGGSNLMASDSGSGWSVGDVATWGGAAGLTMEIFPNPAASVVNLRLQGIGEAGGRLSIFDRLGREVLRQNLSGGARVLTLDLPKDRFVSGEYFLRLVVPEGVLTEIMMVKL